MNTIPRSEKVTRQSTDTMHTARLRRKHLLQESRYNSPRNIRALIEPQSEVSHPKLSDLFLTKSLAVQLSIIFSALHASSTEVLTRKLICTCVGHPQTTEYLTPTQRSSPVSPLVHVVPPPCGAAPPNTLGRNGGGEQSQRKDHMISHRITQIPLATLPGRGPITQQ